MPNVLFGFEAGESMKKLRSGKEECILHAIHSRQTKLVPLFDYGCFSSQTSYDFYFDTKIKHDIQRELNAIFKHSNTEMVTDFYICFKQKTLGFFFFFCERHLG